MYFFIHFGMAAVQKTVNLSINKLQPMLYNTVVLADESETKLCIFQVSSGDTIRVPYFLGRLILPTVADIVSDQLCCQLEDVYVILPDVSFKTISAFKQLLTTGHCSALGTETLESLIEFLPDLKLEKTQCCCTQDQYDDESYDLRADNEKPEDEFHILVENASFDDPPQGSSGEVPSRTYKVNSGCSKFCNQNCHDTVQSWPNEDCLRLKQKFLSDRIIDTKVQLIKHLIAQDDVGQPTSAYVMKGHRFCLEYFAFATGVSLYVVRKVLMDFHEGKRLYSHGNSHCIKSESAAMVSAICWVKSFCESYGQFSPEDNVTVLSHWLTKASLYQMYLDETPVPHISLSSFYDMFKTKFGHNRVDKSLPWIRISKYSTHSVCTTCVALNNNQSQAQTEQELQLAKDLKNSHRMEFGLARRTVEEIKQSSISFPSDNLFLQVDSMDNNKSYLPHYLERSKDLVQKERLPSKITGCTMYNAWYEKKRKVVLFINHDIYENGSNMIITIIYNLLQDFLEEHKSFPRKLHLNVDNCWKGRLLLRIYTINAFTHLNWHL